MSEVQRTIPMRVLENLHREATRIVRPKATYNANNETFLKSVIEEQTDMAVVMANMLNDLLNGENL